MFTYIRSLYSPPPFKHHFGNISICFILALVVLSVYLPIINFDLVDIDDYAIANDLQSRLSSRENILLSFTRIPINTLYWAPVSVFLYIMDVVLWGEQTHLYHCSNLVLHILSTFLVYAIIQKATGYTWKSMLVAILFAIHPINTNAVVIWGNRYTLVEAFFVLLTLAFYMFYTRNPRPMRYLLVLLVFMAALLSKSTAVYLPLLIILSDFWPLNRLDNEADKQEAASFSSLFFEKIPFLSISIVWVFFALYFLRTGTYVGSDGLHYLDIVNLPFNAPVIYMGYVFKTLVPTHLPIPHLNFPMRAPLWLTLCSLITLLGITIFSIRCYKSRPYLLFGWSWYLVTISPYALTLAFYNIDITTRYMYIPSIGLFIMAVWGISDLLSQTVYSKKIIFVLILVFLPVFATASYRQSQKMKEENRYVRHIINSRIHYGAYALAVDPNNTMAHHSLGTAYSRKGKHERAVRHFRKALRINPDDTASLHNLAGVLVEMGKIEEAIRCYYAVLKINPRLYRTHNNLATALAQKREFETAIAHLQKALQINPNYHTARKNLEKILQTKKQARP